LFQQFAQKGCRHFEMRPPSRQETLGDILVGNVELLRDRFSCQPEYAPPNGFPLRYSPRLLGVVGQAQDGVGGSVSLGHTRDEFRPSDRAPALSHEFQSGPRVEERKTILFVRARASWCADLTNSHGRSKADGRTKAPDGHGSANIRQDIECARDIGNDALKLVSSSDTKRHPGMDRTWEATFSVGKGLAEDSIKLPAIPSAVGGRADDVCCENRNSPGGSFHFLLHPSWGATRLCTPFWVQR
jgi:hypothetical protein